MVEEVIKDLADKHIAPFLDGPDPFHITKVPSIIDFLAVPHYDTLIESPVSATLAERELKSLVDVFCKEWRGPNMIPRP